MTARVEMTGQRFGRWMVLSYVGGRKWLCRCECGGEQNIDGRSLRAGRSSGCIRCHNAQGLRRTHGERRSRLYNIWSGIKARCHDPGSPAFSGYGGRGIVVCPEWRESYEAFRDWALANGYRPALTLDRENNDEGYSPGNCRWATYTEQNRNRRDNKPITFRGETLLISELAERHGLPADIVKNRIRRYGWPTEKAVTEPVAARVKREPWVDAGMSKSTWYRARRK